MLEKKNRSAQIGDDGQPMTKWQIWLKRLCSVMVAWAVLDLLIGIVVIAISRFARFDGYAGMSVEEMQAALLALGIASIVGAFVNVVLGFLGVRGAKNPRKIALFFWIALIDAVLTVWSAASSASQGVVDAPAIVSGAFILALAVCAWQVRGQTGYFDNHPVPEDDDEEEDVGKISGVNVRG